MSQLPRDADGRAAGFVNVISILPSGRGPDSPASARAHGNVRNKHKVHNPENMKGSVRRAVGHTTRHAARGVARVGHTAGFYVKVVDSLSPCFRGDFPESVTADRYVTSE